jgi:HK97 family phage major capsid protein
MSLKELTEKLGTLTKANRALMEKADSEQEGVLTTDQEAEYEARDKDIEEALGKIEGLKKQNDRRDRLDRLKDLEDEPVGRLSKPGNLGQGLAAKAESQAIKLSMSGTELTFEPGSQEHARCQLGYQANFNRYLRTGQSAGLTSAEQLGMSVGNTAKGGYLAPMGFVNNLIKFLDDQVFIRGLATVFPNVSPSGMGAPAWETDPGDADWTAEVLATDMAEDDAARTGRREIVPKDLSKLILVSKKLLMGNNTMSAEQLVIQRLGYKFAITEEKGYLTGTGGKDPLGVFTASADGISTGRDVNTVSATAFDADNVIDTFYNLKAAYQAKATWVVSRPWVQRARKLKTSSSGEYIWAPATGDQPSTIMGRPYVMSEYVPSTYTAGKYIAIVGDFSFYWIADCYDITIDRLDELFRLKRQIGFIAEKSTDGMPVLEEAFSRMKTA